MELSLNKFESSLVTSVTSGLCTGHMRSLASATQTNSNIVSSSTVFAVDDSCSSLTMSEHFQNPSSLGAPYSLPLSLPVVSIATCLTGSVCNFSGVSTPGVSSAWLLPSAPATSVQPLTGSASLYQRSSTAVLSGVPGEGQISTSAASCPVICEWYDTRGTEKQSLSLSDFTVTVTDQDMAVSPKSMTSQGDKTSVANNKVPLYPSLTASLVQMVPSQFLHGGHSLSLLYQEGSQVYYYPQGTLTRERGHCLRSYGSVSYTGTRTSVPQPEMVMVLNGVQPPAVQPLASTSGIDYPVSAQIITQTSSQVMETSLGMGTALEWQPPTQTFCLPQTQEFPKFCSSRNIHRLESNSPPQLEHISMVVPVQSSSKLLALPPAPSHEQKQNKTPDDSKIQLPHPREAYQIPFVNQDPPLLPLEIPDSHQVLACIDPLGREEQPGSEKADLGKHSLSIKYQGTFEKGIASTDGFADVSTMVEDIHPPERFNSLNGLDRSKHHEVTKAKDGTATRVNQVQEKSHVTKAPSAQAKKNKRKASEPISGGRRAKIQPPNPECLIGKEVVIYDVATGARAPEDTAKPFNNKPQKAKSSKVNKTKRHGKEKAKKPRENSSQKAEESKQPRDKVKAKENPTNPRMKRTKSSSELNQEAFKKPRSCLAKRMLEAVQVFHALGRKSDKKTGLSSSQPLENSGNPKGPQLFPAIKQRLDILREGKGPDKTQFKSKKPDCSAGKECFSPPQYELPPPGKVKLIPLPFPTLDKPEAQPFSRRPPSLASHRPGVADPAQSSSNTAQPTAVDSSRPAPASFTGPARPSRPLLTNATETGSTKPTRPGLPQSAAPASVPYKAPSCTSVPWELVPTAETKLQSVPKPQTQYLLQDFTNQPIPWRKPNILGPVVSTPITLEQRPEREAMKRQAQLERENAAQYTALGKSHFLSEQEKGWLSLSATAMLDKRC